jgi:hypothetical protein
MCRFGELERSATTHAGSLPTESIRAPSAKRQAFADGRGGSAHQAIRLIVARVDANQEALPK